MFLAQVAHESGEFRYVQELASGSAYEGRKDLGNTEPGDGVRFKGRGLIQITGRANYEACGRAIGADFIADPALMEQPTWAVGSAAWFWQQHGMNELADAENFDAITRRINGGSNGQQDRLAYLMRAKKAMGI
jgi:putative chitinase